MQRSITYVVPGKTIFIRIAARVRPRAERCGCARGHSLATKGSSSRANLAADAFNSSFLCVCVCVDAILYLSVATGAVRDTASPQRTTCAGPHLPDMTEHGASASMTPTRGSKREGTAKGGGRCDSGHILAHSNAQDAIETTGHAVRGGTRCHGVGPRPQHCYLSRNPARNPLRRRGGAPAAAHPGAATRPLHSGGSLLSEKPDSLEDAALAGRDASRFCRAEA